MTEQKTRSIKGELTDQIIESLHAGDQVLYTGTILTARDAAHKRLVELVDTGKELPIAIDGAIIYYAGPAPAKPGKPIGSVGPTSSYRMDPYAPRLLDLGQRAMIGKGARSKSVIDAIIRNKSVYFAAIGGAAALIAKCVKNAEVLAYEDLGTEAIRKLEVVDMPLTVAIDCTGNNIYEMGPAEYLASR
jgi:fumarate hydratase subunit beta